MKSFEASQFTPTKWDSAEQKAKFANHFMRFVKGGCRWTLFYTWFYRKLSNTFGHIAHYDRRGFFAKFFQNADGKVQFLRTTLKYPCYGDATHTYSDVERAIQKAVKEEGLMEKALREREKTCG